MLNKLCIILYSPPSYHEIKMILTDIYFYCKILKGLMLQISNNNVQNNFEAKGWITHQYNHALALFHKILKFLECIICLSVLMVAQSNMTPELFFAVRHFLHTRNLNYVWGKDAFFDTPWEKL